MQNGSPPRRTRNRQPQAPERVMRTAGAMQQGGFRPDQLPPQGYPGYPQQPRPQQPPPQQTIPPHYQQPPYQPPQSQPQPQPEMIPNRFTGRSGYVPPNNTHNPPPPAGGSRKPKPRSKGGAGRILLIALLVIALIGVGISVVSAMRRNAEARERESYVASLSGVYIPGIVVDGIAVGGMTPQDGYDAVAAQAMARSNAWSVSLTYRGNTLTTITAGQLGMNADVAEVMNAAWALGHSGGTEARYSEIERVRREGQSFYTVLPSGDTSVLDGILAQVKAAVDTPAVDAQLLTFEPALSYPFTFRNEQVGLSLDIEPLKAQLYEMVSTMTGGTVEVQPTQIQPAVTVAQLQEKLAIRASVYTPISKDSTDNRNNNIRRCFELISGKMVAPGKKFSFNTTVGKRTMANGFYEAIEYAYGEHVMGIGGGTCQASTTLYQACVLAGLQIVDRSPHSDSVSYAGYGTDATVYWEGKRNIDFVFKNNTDSPIYIVAAVETDPTNNRRLIARCTLYGESLGNTRYELYAEEIEELPIPEAPTYRKDTKATYVTYVDEEKQTSNGKVGHVVVSYRITYENNVETARTQLFKDTYNAQPIVIYVGTTKRE